MNTWWIVTSQSQWATAEITGKHCPRLLCLPPCMRALTQRHGVTLENKDTQSWALSTFQHILKHANRYWMDISLKNVKEITLWGGLQCHPMPKHLQPASPDLGSIPEIKATRTMSNNSLFINSPSTIIMYSHPPPTTIITFFPTSSENFGPFIRKGCIQSFITLQYCFKVRTSWIFSCVLSNFGLASLSFHFLWNRITLDILAQVLMK